MPCHQYMYYNTMYIMHLKSRKSSICVPNVNKYRYNKVPAMFEMYFNVKYELCNTEYTGVFKSICCCWDFLFFFFTKPNSS